jgi:hypothetical protein
MHYSNLPLFYVSCSACLFAHVRKQAKSFDLSVLSSLSSMSTYKHCNLSIFTRNIINAYQLQTNERIYPSLPTRSLVHICLFLNGQRPGPADISQETADCSSPSSPLALQGTQITFNM